MLIALHAGSKIKIKKLQVIKIKLQVLKIKLQVPLQVQAKWVERQH